MAQPVWVLSVDLQTKTATFQSGLADAARSARGAFGEIKSGAGEMGQGVEYSMGEARHSAMALAEIFGGHMPRMVAGFIASIGPLGAALEAAFPFLAIALGAALLIEHLVKLHEAGEKLTEDQTKFGLTVLNAFNQLDQKMLQAEIRADELRKDHLGALKHQLELIDQQSMSELIRTFEELAKAADQTFGDLKTSWYEMGVGSGGAKHALDEFHNEYNKLLLTGKEEEAGGLLKGTLDQAVKLRDLQADAIKTKPQQSWTGGQDYDKVTRFQAIMTDLKKSDLDITDKSVKSQQALVDALQAQVEVASRVSALKRLEDSNAKTTTSTTINDERNKHADAVLKYNAAVNRMMTDDDKQANADLQRREHEAIEITQDGSAGRLAAISAALQEEEAYGRQGTEFYASLVAERVALVHKMTQEEGRLQAEAGREAADNDLKMGELQLSALKQYFAMRDSSLRANIERETAEQIQLANAEFELKKKALQKEVSALDTGSQEYQNKLRALQDKERQLVQQHENELTQIKERATLERNRRILSAEDQFENSMARGMASALMGHETFAKMITSLGDQVASGMIENAVKSLIADDMTRERDAAFAARKAFMAGMQLPFPANIVAAPILAAGAFASVMAFSGGGIVPGVGLGDVVPSVLTPGEAVLPKGLTESLTRAGRSGSDGASHVTHVHFRPVVHALDSDGVDKVLTKHADKIQKHVSNAVRRMNK